MGTGACSRASRLSVAVASRRFRYGSKRGTTAISETLVVGAQRAVRGPGSVGPRQCVEGGGDRLDSASQHVISPPIALVSDAGWCSGIPLLRSLTQCNSHPNNHLHKHHHRLTSHPQRGYKKPPAPLTTPVSPPSSNPDPTFSHNANFQTSPADFLRQPPHGRIFASTALATTPLPALNGPSKPFQSWILEFGFWIPRSVTASRKRLVRPE